MWLEWTLSLFLTLVFAFCLLKRLSNQQQHKQEWPTGHLYITSDSRAHCRQMGSVWGGADNKHATSAQP